MAEYEMQESNLPNEEGKRILFPRMKLWNQVNLEYIASNINYASTFTPGDIIGLVHSLTQRLPTKWHKQFGKGRRTGHLHASTGIAQRQRTGIGREKGTATKCDEHLRTEY